MNVKDLRIKLNLTQHELAAITGIPRDRIAKWEQGKGGAREADPLKPTPDAESYFEGRLKMGVFKGFGTVNVTVWVTGRPIVNRHY
jgi:transcriptional regulator with XRE-family HTH domain